MCGGGGWSNLPDRRHFHKPYLSGLNGTGNCLLGPFSTCLPRQSTETTGISKIFSKAECSVEIIFCFQQLSLSGQRKPFDLIYLSISLNCFLPCTCLFSYAFNCVCTYAHQAVPLVGVWFLLSSQPIEPILPPCLAFTYPLDNALKSLSQGNGPCQYSSD